MSEVIFENLVPLPNDLIWLSSDGRVHVLSAPLPEPSDAGYPGAYPLPPDGTPIVSDSEWAAQNERIRKLVESG